ncbi:hypothetical protein [Streptomyces sp. NPDC006463]|uniref:terpene synthase family protein n=1 Tax=Streptomyces sp. NPDC006463 TaxID=3364746 RepID=UPI0036A8CA20
MPVYCPWPGGLYAATDWKHIEASAVAWYGSQDLPEPPELYSNTTSGYGMCRAFPDAVDATALRLITQYSVWAFFYDDHITARNTSAAHVRACLAASDRVFDTLGAPVPEPCRYIAAQRDLAERWRASMPESTWSFLATGWRSWITSIIPGRPVTTVNAYLSWRHLDDASPVYTPMPLATGNYTLSSEQWNDPRVIAVRHAMGLITGIDNDLSSPTPEPHSPHLLDILAAEADIPRPQAVHEAVALRNLLTCRLEHLVADLNANAKEPLGRYAGQVAQITRGHLDWYEVTRRYRERPDRIPPITLSPVSGHPDHDCHTVLPWPAVSWWWSPC